MLSFSTLFRSSVALAFCALSLPSQAITYSFACLSNTNPANCANGTANLTMDVTAASGNQVDFTFRNFSSPNSVISEVYFDDGTLLGISSLIDSGAGVNFTRFGVSPANLPAGNLAFPPFQTTAGFSADVVKNTNDGVGNALDGGVQEFLTVRFSLINGQTFNDTINALNGTLTHTTSNGTPYPALRVGLHVRAFSDGGSESFLAESPFYVSSVPEPGNYALVLSGLGLLAAIARRKSQV